MKIQLLSATPNAKRVAFAAIRSCYSPDNAIKLFNEEFDKYDGKIIDGDQRDSDRLMRQIAASGHTSTLEHIVFTFAIEGISRACLAQLTRHRIASYSVQSQRYVKQNTESKHGDATMVFPNVADEIPMAREIYAQTFEYIQSQYNDLIALGVKAEDARAILPQASTCNLVMTINLRSLLNFYKLRNKNTHAQAEIQNVAEEFRAIVVKEEPWLNWFFENIK